MISDDLFAGAGGWDLAAARLDIHARGVENMKEARATRDAAGLTTIHDDVWTFRPDGKATGLIASPPCQTFSAAGKGSGRKALEDVLRGIRDGYVGSLDHLRFLGLEVGDERTSLVLTPLHFATQYEYEWLAWEQVPTVLPVWEACAEVLRARGWHVWTGLLHAEQYGVPQTRKRAFLLASRTAVVDRPTPSHSRYYSRTPEKLDAGVAKWVSMAEALGWERGVEVVSNYGTGGDAKNRGVRSGEQPSATVTEKIGRNYVYRANKMPNGAWRRGDQPAPTIAFGHDSASVRWFQTRNSGPGAARTPRPTDGPSYTIRAAGSGSHPSGVEWDEGERVTVQEAAILQSFPADFPWQGAKGKRYLQAGNAVPPGLALHALAAAAGVDAREVAA